MATLCAVVWSEFREVSGSDVGKLFKNNFFQQSFRFSLNFLNRILEFLFQFVGNVFVAYDCKLFSNKTF